MWFSLPWTTGSVLREHSRVQPILKLIYSYFRQARATGIPEHGGHHLSRKQRVKGPNNVFSMGAGKYSRLWRWSKSRDHFRGERRRRQRSLSHDERFVERWVISLGLIKLCKRYFISIASPSGWRRKENRRRGEELHNGKIYKSWEEQES